MSVNLLKNCIYLEKEAFKNLSKYCHALSLYDLLLFLIILHAYRNFLVSGSGAEPDWLAPCAHPSRTICVCSCVPQCVGIFYSPSRVWYRIWSSTPPRPFLFFFFPVCDLMQRCLTHTTPWCVQRVTLKHTPTQDSAEHLFMFAEAFLILTSDYPLGQKAFKLRCQCLFL